MIYGAEYAIWAAESPTCESCGRAVESLEACIWDPDLMVGECCRVHSDDLPAELICPVLSDLLMQAETGGDLPGLAKVHAITCAHCSSDQATVQTDRLYVDPAAVCCEVAA